MARNGDTSGEGFESGRAGVPDTHPTVPLTRSGSGAQHPTTELPEVVHAAEDLASKGLRLADEERDAPVAGSSEAAGATAPAPATGTVGRALRALFWLVATVGLVMALVLSTRAAGWWPNLSNPFGEKQTDRSQPALLTSIQDLSRYVAAEGNFQIVIDLQNDRKYVPDFLVNQRTLFVAAGTVEAYVDFATIGQGAITDSPDHKTVEIKLPAPALGKPNLDHDKSYVFAEQRGVINRLGEFFVGDTNREQQLYLLAEQKMTDAAKDSKLSERAQKNTHDMLESLLKSLGYTRITITFASP
jgi:hypothetical protein